MRENLLTADRTEALRNYWRGKRLSEFADYIHERYHVSGELLIAKISDEIESLLKNKPAEAADLLLHLRNVRDMLNELLLAHMREEEEKLFPAIRALETGGKPESGLGSMARISDEHDQVVDVLINQMLEGTLLRLPETGGGPLVALRKLVAEFLVELREHVFLEDEILFIEALEMETRVKAAAGAALSKKTRGGQDI